MYANCESGGVLPETNGKLHFFKLNVSHDDKLLLHWEEEIMNWRSDT